MKPSFQHAFGVLSVALLVCKGCMPRLTIWTTMIIVRTNQTTTVITVSRPLVTEAIVLVTDKGRLVPTAVKKYAPSNRNQYASRLSPSSSTAAGPS